MAENCHLSLFSNQGKMKEKVSPNHFSAWPQSTMRVQRKLPPSQWSRVQVCILQPPHSLTTQHNRAPQCKYCTVFKFAHTHTHTGAVPSLPEKPDQEAYCLHAGYLTLTLCCRESPEAPQQWQSKLRSKGSFFFECDTLISHQYQVTHSHITSVPGHTSQFLLWKDHLLVT